MARQEGPLLPLQDYAGSPNHQDNKQKAKDWKGRNELSLSVDDMTLYEKHPEEFRDKLVLKRA